jgi:hypothetical protein
MFWGDFFFVSKINFQKKRKIVLSFDWEGNSFFGSTRRVSIFNFVVNVHLCVCVCVLCVKLFFTRSTMVFYFRRTVWFV